MDDAASAPEADKPARGKPAHKRPLAARIALWAAAVLGGLVALIAIGLVVLDTAPGHRLIVGLVRKQTMANGLKIGLQAIDGSIYGRATLRGITLSDTQGAFLTSPGLTLDWSPGPLLQKHIVVHELSAATIRVIRRPAFRAEPPKPNQPTIPNIYLDLDRLHVGSLIFEPAVTGERRALSIDGSAQLMSGRAQVNLVARAQPVDGHTGGDMLSVKLDAAPDQNRLTIDAHLIAPQGGVVDRLAKLDAPLSFDLTGHGTWKAWDGRAVAMLSGQPLLDTTLTARDGLFGAKGQAMPARLVKGPAADLTAPALAFDLAGRMQDRQLDANAHIASSAFDLVAGGRLDLAKSRFQGVRATGRLLKPAAASPKLTGEQVRLQLTLNGAFSQPLVDYDLAARRIGFDKTVIENLHARGKARVDADRTIRLPVHAMAGRVLGVDAAVGGLVDNLRVDGDVNIGSKLIATDNLRLRSKQLDATLIFALSLDTGRYQAALKGRVNAYAVKGLGVVNVVTDARVIPTGKGQFRIAGHVHGQTVRIDNPSALNFLGGNAVVDADISGSSDGTYGVANLRLTAPKFRVTSGRGSYRADGRIALSASAVSSQYGPLQLDVAGTVAKPQARLRAASPNVGGLSGVDLQLKGTAPGAYAVTITAASAYGRIAGDVGVQTGAGGVRADIRRLSVGEIAVSGQVRQTADGPFAGQLALSGSGLSGTVRLSAEGKVQRADAALRARDARLPLTPPVTIARGVIDASAILYPNAPAVTAMLTLSGVRQADLLVADAKANIDYRGGSGRVDISASGNRGVPFTIAANAGLTPTIITVNGQGSINRIALRLAGPARITKVADGYQLAPTTISLPQGRLDLSGQFGKATRAQARLDNLDLSIAQAFAPDLGINGKASGTLNVALPSGGAMPTGQATLQISNFTRTGLNTVSEPIDLTLLATLAPTGADAHALVRRRGAVIGRLQARLGPVAGGTGADWMKRLQAAPLTGGLRYNGPSEALWALGGISGQSLSGPIAIGVDVGGRLEHPTTNGVVRAQNLRYENNAFGTVIDQIVLDGRFNGTRFDLAKLTGRAGGGSVQASGYADVSSANGFPVDIKVRLAEARLASSDDIRGTLTGDVSVSNTKSNGALIAGKLTVNQAAYQIVRQTSADVPELTGVRRKGEPLVKIEPDAATGKAPSGPPSVWRLDIDVRANNQLFVRGMGLDAEFGSDLKISGDATHPVIIGDINLVRGTFSFAGRSLDLSRGVIHLNGSSPPNPTLDIQASTTVDAVTTTITIAGTAQAPDITFSSTPSLPQDEVLSRLLFGSSVTQLSPLQAVQLATALNSLRGSGGGLNPLGKLRQVAGLDRLKFYGEDKTSGRGPSVGAGKYIAKNIYLEITTDARGYTATQIEVALTRTLRLLSQVGAVGSTNLNLRYSHDY